MGDFLIFIGLFLTILFLILQLIYEDKPFIIGCLCIFLTAVGIYINKTDEIPVPTEEDVFSGKAIYVETIHITGEDTVKTYRREWKMK